jgi:hypothetical protein
MAIAIGSPVNNIPAYLSDLTGNLDNVDSNSSRTVAMVKRTEWKICDSELLATTDYM